MQINGYYKMYNYLIIEAIGISVSYKIIYVGTM